MSLSNDSTKKQQDNDHNQLSLNEQVALDLAKYLDQFPNKTFAIRVLSQETGLHGKTIKRLLKQSNRPTYQTLLKLYPVFLNVGDFQSLMEVCPTVVREELENYSTEENLVDNSKNEKLLEMFKDNPLMAELFILAGSGSLNQSTIGFRYGEYGLELLEKLKSEKLVIEIKKGEFILSNNVPQLNGKHFKFLGEYFIKRFCKPENAQTMSENSISFYAEGLNKKGKEEWLKIDRESFYKKLKIANNPIFKGDIPIFTFNATDTIQMEKLK